jgi:hypothetical protein
MSSSSGVGGCRGRARLGCSRGHGLRSVFLALALAMLVVVAWRTRCLTIQAFTVTASDHVTWQSDTWNTSQRCNDHYFLYIYICFYTSHTKSLIVVTYKLL